MSTKYREKILAGIKNDTIDYYTLIDDMSPLYQKVLKQNLKHIERYGKEKNLTPEQIETLKENEIIIARTNYLNEKSHEAARSGDELAERYIRANNAETDALKEQYYKRQAKLGKHAKDIDSYIEKANIKNSQR